MVSVSTAKHQEDDDEEDEEDEEDDDDEDDNSDYDLTIVGTNDDIYDRDAIQ